MLLASAIPPFAGSAPANVFAAGPASDSMRPGTPQGITQPGRGEFDQVSPLRHPVVLLPPEDPVQTCTGSLEGLRRFFALLSSP